METIINASQHFQHMSRYHPPRHASHLQHLDWEMLQKGCVLIRNRCSQIWRRNYEKPPFCWLENIRNTHGFLKKLSVRPIHWLLKHLGVHETSWMWNRFKHEELRLKSPGSCTSWSRDRPQNPIGWVPPPASYLGHSRCVDSIRNMLSMNIMKKCPSHWFLYPADCTGTSELEQSEQSSCKVNPHGAWTEQRKEVQNSDNWLQFVTIVCTWLTSFYPSLLNVLVIDFLSFGTSLIVQLFPVLPIFHA